MSYKTKETSKGGKVKKKRKLHGRSRKQVTRCGMGAEGRRLDIVVGNREDWWLGSELITGEKLP